MLFGVRKQEMGNGVHMNFSYKLGTIKIKFNAREIVLQLAM